MGRELNQAWASQETVFLVDDDPSVLRAVARLVRSAGWNVSTFDSPRRFLEQQMAGEAECPGCLVVDVTMPGLTGFDLQQVLGKRRPIIFLTGTGDIPMSVRAMKSGAVNFLSKPCNDDELLAAIGEALQLDRQGRRDRSERNQVTARFDLLTPREFEVMRGVAAGKLNKQIAADLDIVEKTVKVHRARVMEKLQVASVAALVQLTVSAGMIIEPE